MSRFNTVCENWKDVITRLRTNKQELAQFLRFAAGMYKQSFSDAALIYNQNPNATKVTTLETWNKLGRIVNRGEHSIAVFGEEHTCRHLFDISQTSGKRIPELWHLDEELAVDVTATINEKYGRDNRSIQETIAAVAVDNIKLILPEMRFVTEQMKLSQEQITAYQRSLVSAVRFTISNRCEISGGMKISGGLNLNAVDLFKDNRDLIRFCDMVQKASKNALLELEHEIVQIQKRKKEHTYERQNEHDRTVSDTDRVHGQRAERGAPSQADRQVGQAVAGMGENRVPDGSTGVHNGRAVADNTAPDRQGGGEPVLGAGRAVPEGKSASDDFRGDTRVGEDAPVDDRTSVNAGGSLSASDITVENLKKRYLDSDFNRRLDSYEIAGFMLSESEGTKISAVEWFDRYFADRYSALQGEEIRSLIETAVRNRDLTRGWAEPEPVEKDDLPETDAEILIQPESEKETSESEEESEEQLASDVEEIKPDTDAQYAVMHNKMILSSDLPCPDEQVIRDILKSDRFFHVKKDEIVSFFWAEHDETKRAEFMKTAINPEYCELDIGDKRVGYKSFNDGVVVWEGNYPSRTKEAGLSWDFVQSITFDMIRKDKYMSEPEKKAAREEWEASDKLVIYAFRADEQDNIIADCEIHGKRFETPIERTEEGIPYIIDGKVPHQLDDIQEGDLHKFELYRSPIVHDKNGYYADDLDEEDKIKLDGETWTVEKKTDYMIHLSRENGEDKHFYEHWQEAITKAGFEYINENAPVIEKTVAAKEQKTTKKKSAPEPMTGGEQLSFFGEPVDVAEPTKPKKREKLRLVYPAIDVTPEMIDHALRGCSGKPQSLERIAYQFRLGKTERYNEGSQGYVHSYQ